MVRIAIDGPGGAGKSTIARMVAKDLSIDYVDTGAMYRAIAYKIKEAGVSLEDKAGVAALLSGTEIDFSDGNVILDGEVVNGCIRTPEISKLASDCSVLAEVREKLVALQREMGSKKSAVMDGRDIGTNVLKDAEFKFYMTASSGERARRRYDELKAKGQETPFYEVLADITARDLSDMTRALNPLRKAADAIELDTTEMTVDEVREYILGVVREKKGDSHGDSQAVSGDQAR